MVIRSAKFITSLAELKDFPGRGMPEIAIVGKSNVGKSSLINKLANNGKLARTSSEPGKTRLINLYELNHELMLVDLPGYGYAARSKKEVESWGAMIDGYLTSRPQLCQVVQLVDSRHKPSAEDVAMQEWIKECCAYSVVFATKSDKLSKKQLEENLEMIAETLDLRDGDILIPFSVKDNESVENFWEYVEGCVLDDEGETE